MRLWQIFRRPEPPEPWESWPMCLDCQVRFPTHAELDQHYDREPICGPREGA
jgi:hypothetical protein